MSVKISPHLPLLLKRFAVVALCIAPLPGKAQVLRTPLPHYVVGPSCVDNGICFRELFEKPDQWKETRAMTDCLLYAGHAFGAFSDDELKAWFAQMHRWNLKLELEVGAVKEWGAQTGQSTFQAEEPGMDRVERLGGDIYSLAFDEPFCNVRIQQRSEHRPDEYAIEETAKFISLVRQRYPQIRLGDIEPYPSIPLKDHIMWITALQKRLAQMNVKGMDFYRVDVDWTCMTLMANSTWQDVGKIQDFCASQKLPFSLIYWDAPYDSLKSRNLADDSTWYVGVMDQGYAYASIKGAPQQYVLEDWVGAPNHSVPETTEWTFMRSALDFGRKFVQAGK
jgi:hypothetical protein